MGTITINVTQEDIDKGHRSSSVDCPVALALERVFPNRLVGIWYKGVLGPFEPDFARYETNIKSSTGSHELPVEVADKITAFDKGETIQPFSFEW